MPTIQQLVRKGRIHLLRRANRLFGFMSKRRGVCTRVYTTTPKKPNSTLRKLPE